MLVAATSSALVVAFIVPLCALIVTVADDRASARARDQAQSVAALIGTVQDPAALERAIQTLAAAGPPVLVVTPSGTLIGATGSLAPDTSLAVTDVRTKLEARTVHQDHGIDSLVPVAVGKDAYVVVATVPEADARSGVTAGWAALLTLGAVLIGVSVLLARALGRRVSTPVSDLGLVAHRLYEGDLSARATPAGTEETREVGLALNRLADRIGDLLEAERERVADLGHRLRTPVTALRLAADQLRDREAAARIDSLIDTLHHSVDEVVRDARRPLRTGLPTPTDLVACVKARTTFWTALAEDQGRSATLVLGAGSNDVVLVGIHESEIHELLDTLFDNYFSHTPSDAPVRVTVGADEAWGWFDVSDGGPGLATYSGRGHSGSGSTGLGLDIVTRRAEAAAGSVTIGASDLGGFSVRVTLPRVQ